MQRPKPGKGQLPGLQSGPVPLLPIRDAAKQQLVDLIDTKRGKKALILDPSLSGPLTQLDAGLSELFTEHGVAKLMYLERLPLTDPSYGAAEPPLSTIRPLLYILRATLDNAALLAWQLKHSSQALSQHEVSVFWVPRRSVACESLLEEEGVYGAAIHAEFPLEMVALDEDVLSLELDRAFRECVLEGDTSALFYAAAGLVRLQLLYGLIPRIQGKGPAAAFVKETSLRMLREQQLPLRPASSAWLQRVILIDREVDVVTPMLTQITFEGLIDEITGIKNSAVQYAPRGRDGPDPGGGSSAAAAAGGVDGGRGRVGSTLLNSTDPFYKEFRDLPYYIASQRLQTYAKDARREYNELGTKDLSGLKVFVKGLPKLLLLDRLSDIAVPVAEVVKQQTFHDRLKVEMDILEAYELEEAVRYCQELMWRGSELLPVLRLLVLLSCCQGGLARKQLDTLRGELLSCYGHQHLATLQALERAGLLRPAGAPGGGAGGVGAARPTFPALRKALRLVVSDDTQMDNPTDVSHLYKGYAPISIRLVEAALAGGWGAVGGAGGRGEGLAAVAPGPQFDLEQVQQADGSIKVSDHRGGPAAGATSSSVAAAASGGTAAAAAASGSGTGAGEQRKAAAVENVLVVFLGGATFTEISALRFLSSRPDATHRFLVMTTKIINGSTLLDTFIDPEVRNFLGSKDGLGRAA